MANYDFDKYSYEIQKKEDELDELKHLNPATFLWIFAAVCAGAGIFGVGAGGIGAGIFWAVLAIWANSSHNKHLDKLRDEITSLKLKDQQHVNNLLNEDLLNSIKTW